MYKEEAIEHMIELNRYLQYLDYQLNNLRLLDDFPTKDRVFKFMLDEIESVKDEIMSMGPETEMINNLNQ